MMPSPAPWPVMPHGFFRFRALVHIGRHDGRVILTRCRTVPHYSRVDEVVAFPVGDLCPLCWSGTADQARAWVATSIADPRYLTPIDDAPEHPWPWEGF